MIIQLPTWQQVRRSPQVRQLLRILQLLLQHILAVLQRFHVPHYAGIAGDFALVQLRRFGNALYEEIPPLPEFPPEYRELLLLPQKLAELPQHIPEFMFPSYWKAVYDDLPPLPPYVYPSWWRELYNGLPGWLFPSYYRNLALDAILKIWSIYIGFLASRPISQEIEDSPQELYETLSQTRDAVVELLQEDALPPQTVNQTRDAVVELLQEDALPPQTVSQKPQTEILVEEEEEEPVQQQQEEEVWSVESGKGGKGLSRYSGVENLVEQSDGTAPIAVSVQTRPRHTMVLSSIPDTPEQPRPPLPPLDEPEKPDISTTEDEFEDVSESSSKDKDGIWASLVSKYSKPEKPKKEKSKELEDEFIDDGPEYVGTADEIVERYTAKSAVSLDLDENEDDGRPMTDDDFTKVGHRLEEYLSRLDGVEEVTSEATKVKSNEIKEDGLQVLKESETLSSTKEKQLENIESLEEEDISGEEAEREPTMEDIEAELRRLEEMEAEIALMEQQQKELPSEDAEDITASEVAGMSETEKTGNEIKTGELETLQPVELETKVASETETVTETLMPIKPKESLITEEKQKSDVYEEISSSEIIAENLESLKTEEKIASKMSENIIESVKSNENLEPELSNKLEDHISKEVIVLEKSQDKTETQPLEYKLEVEASEAIDSEKYEEKLESQLSGDKPPEDKLKAEVSKAIDSEKSEEKLEPQLLEDKLASQISEDKIESQTSEEILESEESTEYTETTESESEPITELPAEKIKIEISASITDSGSIKGFFTNLWNRADNQQIVEKSFEKTVVTEPKQAIKGEDLKTDVSTEESEPKTQEITSSDASTDPSSIKDFFQTLWTCADNHVTLEKKKEIEAPHKDEVENEKAMITEENKVDIKEPKTLLETDLDEQEEESEVSVEVIVKPEDKPVPKSILKKPSFDLTPSPQEETFEMKVEKLKAEIGEKPVVKSFDSTEEKTFEMKVKELKADMMDKATFKKPFMEELEQEKTFEMKIEALKSQMEEVEIEVKSNDDDILKENENIREFNGVTHAELLEDKIDEKDQEKIIEKESIVVTDLVQSKHLEEKDEQLNTDVSVEGTGSKAAVSAETEHDKDDVTIASDTAHAGISVIEAIHSTVPQSNDIHTLVSEKVDSDIKAELAMAMEEKEESEIKVESANENIPTPDTDVEIKDELKQSIKEADVSPSSDQKTRRPPAAAWRGWSQATLDDVGDLENEADIDESIIDLSKRKGSTISDSGSVKGFFENLWKCAEVEGIKHKSSIDSKSRSESVDAGSLLESGNGKKETSASIDMPEKQTEISQSEKISDVVDIVSDAATPEEVTAAAVMTEFWGRRIEESDDEDILTKQNILAEKITPVSDFWNRNILEGSSVEKETSTAPIIQTVPVEEITPVTDFWNRKILEDSSVEKETSAPAIKQTVPVEEITPVSDFWNRKILEDSSVEKETSAPVIKQTVLVEEITPVSDFWNRKILEDSSVEKETSAPAIKQTVPIEEVTPVSDFWNRKILEDSSVEKETSAPAIKQTVPAEEISPVSEFWNRKILEDSSAEKETTAAAEDIWGTIDNKNNKAEEVITNGTDYRNKLEDSSIEKEPSASDGDFWGTITDINKVADEVKTNVTDYKNVLNDSIVEKEPSVSVEDFWGTIDKNNKAADAITIVADYWGSETENLKSSQKQSNIQDGLTTNEEFELKNYLELKDESETDAGSMDIGSIKELDKTIGKYSPMTISLEKDDSIPKHLEDVEDLLIPARPPRRGKKSPVNVDDDVDIPETDPYMRKYMEMPANLTEDEEMELREYMEQHKDESEELSLERYLEMNPDLTEGEKTDYEELLMERQQMRERERKELEKYLDMPVGLTEEEKRELEMMEKEEGDEGEEWDEARNFRELLDMPADLTEDELRILQDDAADEEMEFEDEEAYRQYIRHKFLMQLDEEAYANYDDDEGGYGYETEYEGDGEYGYETEYEGDEGEYVMVDEEEEDAAVVEQPKTSMVDDSVNTDSVLKKTKRIFGFKKSSNENSSEGSPALGKKFGFKKGSSEEKSKEESPAATKKKVGFSKLASKDTSDEGSPASAKKKFGFPKLVTKESNESGSPATQKKFFHFGGLGTKKKKGTSDENLDKPGGNNSFTVGFCTIERDLHDVMEHFSDFNGMNVLKKKSLDNAYCKNKEILENDLNEELCKSLSGILNEETTKSKQTINSSLLSTSRIKHECEIPEVFLYSPPAEETKYQRELISPGEEDLDFWHQWQSEEVATVRLSSEWVDDLDVIEEESEFGDLDIIYEESEEEYNSEDKTLEYSNSEKYQLTEEINAFSDHFMPENFNNMLDNQNPHEETLLKNKKILERNQCKDKGISRENSEEEIDKGLERISEEIYELTEENETCDWWGQINTSDNSTSNFGDLVSHSVLKITESTQNTDKSSDTVGNEISDISGEINKIEIESTIVNDNEYSFDVTLTTKEDTKYKLVDKVDCKYDIPKILINEIEEKSLNKDISVMPIIEVKKIVLNNIDSSCVKQVSLPVIPRIEITEAEENDPSELSYLNYLFHYEDEKVNEFVYSHNSKNEPLTECSEREKDKDNISTEMKLVEPLSVQNCEKSSLVKIKVQSNNIEDINTIMVGISEVDSDSEESESLGYMPLEEESDSLGSDVNVNTELDNAEEMSVICIERTDSEGNISPAVKNRTVKEEEDILQCLDNEIGTLIDKIKSVHNVNIDTNELVLNKNIVNKSLFGEVEVKSTLGNCNGEVGTSRDIKSIECVDKFRVTSSPRASRSNSSGTNSINSNSSNSSQHIPHSGDTILSATVIGSAMADVDDNSDTRMEVDEGVEDAEEIEVQENAAADKEEEEDEEEAEDVIGNYVTKQEKMDEEALTFNKDDDDDDELPDFDKKPKKKSSKPSKENGVDEEKKKKKRRKAPDGKKRRSSRTEREEKENKKATYQKDDILAKHVGPRVRSFDSNKIQKKFDKPKTDDIDDILAKKVGPRVRSFDAKKIQKNFNKPKPASSQLSNDCKMCGKQVYQMEKIVAEKASWHKNCFRCKECNKNLTLETYQSHEGNLYCKPHFKELFQPKAVVEDENVARQERSTDKPDYGLEELSSANVKQKFSMFENKGKEKDNRRLEPAHVRRSQSLMDKAARFLKQNDDGDSEGEYGVENSYLGEYDDEDDDDDDEDEEEEEEEEEEDEYEEVEVTDEDAEEEEETKVNVTKVNGTKVNGTKVNGEHDEENEDEEKDDEDEEKEDEEKEDEEEIDEDEVKENGFNEEESRPKKKVTKIIRVKKEKPKKEKKEKKSRRERPMSIAGGAANELKSQWETKSRRDRMRETRSKELSKFRAMLCAGKNTNLKEMFESGKIDNCDSDDEKKKRKEQIKIERAQGSRNIKDRFEKGEAFGGDSDDERNYTDERRECEEIFREAETARAARNRFRQIDSKVKGEGRDGRDILRSQSFANAPISNRRPSQEGPVDTEIVRACDANEDFDIDTTDLASRFKFFSNYQDIEKKKVEEKRRSRSFRFTPPREGVVKVDEEKDFMARMPKACMAINCPVCRLRGGAEPIDLEEFGRDPNYVKSTDKFDDNIDCARTKKLLDMFKKMEMQGSDEDERGPPPPRRFTPPPEGEEYDSEEYSDEEYTDDDEEDEDEYTDDEEDEDEDEDGNKVPKYKDEVLEMLSARKAASLRAKFEKWEDRKNELNRNSDEEEEGGARPSIDSARNLRKMFENKATEQPVLVNKPKHKVNRFV